MLFGTKSSLAYVLDYLKRGMTFLGQDKFVVVVVVVYVLSRKVELDVEDLPNLNWRISLNCCWNHALILLIGCACVHFVFAVVLFFLYLFGINLNLVPL